MNLEMPNITKKPNFDFMFMLSLYRNK